MNNSPQLFLRVNNPQKLEHGSLPDFRPDQRGATIGSQGADWQLYDSAGSIAANHAAIRWMDGRYVLVDLCGKTYINAHQDPLGRLQIVALCDGDLLTIGKYKISVHLDAPMDTQAYGADHLREINLSQLMGLNAADTLLQAAPETAQLTHTTTATDLTLNQFTGQQGQFTSTDPLAHLSPIKPEPVQPVGLTPIPLRLSDDYVADYTGTTRESVALAVQPTGNNLMTLDPIQPTETGMATETHLASTPLFNALGVPLEGINTAQAHQLIQEAGRTLRTTIQALLQLYQADRDNPLQLSLLGRSYQAIEDNPLRMNLDYDDTVQAMFSGQRSRVHLTPERAIEESMDNINKSQQAMVSAIQESLQHILQALSPDHLATRFADYQRNQTGQAATDADNWQLYRDYFTELTSHRQSGLEKMFWEVFSQTYDRHMRNEPQQ